MRYNRYPHLYVYETRPKEMDTELGTLIVPLRLSMEKFPEASEVKLASGVLVTRSQRCDLLPSVPLFKSLVFPLCAWTGHTSSSTFLGKVLVQPHLSWAPSLSIVQIRPIQLEAGPCSLKT